MFRCGECKQNSSGSANRKVTRARNKTYPERKAANLVTLKDGSRRFTDDPGGKGWEIVKEILICSDCFALLV